MREDNEMRAWRICTTNTFATRILRGKMHTSNTYRRGEGEKAEKLGSKKCTRGQCTGEYQKRGAIEFFVTKS